MIIDVHGYLSKDTPAGRLVTYAGVCGVDWVLVANRDAATTPAGAADLDEPDANVACLQAGRTHQRLIPLYWVRVGQPDSHVNAVIGALTTEPFAGTLFAPTAGDFDVESPHLRAYLNVLAGVGRPVIFAVDTSRAAAPEKVYAWARQYPALPFVMCHVEADSHLRAMSSEMARRAVDNQDARLYVDTAHATAEQVRAQVATCGANRVLFGTNAVSYGDTHVPRHIALLDDLRRMLDRDDLVKVTGGNAQKLFRIGASAASDPSAG